MVRIKKYIMAAALLAMTTALQAQHKHEFSVYGAGGLSGLKYSTSAGSLKKGFGGSAGAEYKYFFSEKLGIATGVGLGFYNSEFSLGNLSDRYMTTDRSGDPFEFRTVVSGYKEKQRVMFLQIPLMLQYQTGGNHKFYAAAGGKIAIPLRGRYESSGATLRNSGYYAHEDYEYTTQEFMGFGIFTGRSAKSDLDLKTAFLLSAEAGVKWKLNGKMSLYTGAFVDYGLNDIMKSGPPSRFVQYVAAVPKNFAVNSILYSQYSGDGPVRSFAGKVSLLSAGIKVQLAFGRGCSKRGRASASTRSMPPAEQQTDNSVQQAEEGLRKAAKDQEWERERTSEENYRRQREAEAAAAQQKAGTELAEAKQEIAVPINFYDVDQTQLSATQKNELDTKIIMLKKYPELNVACEGYTCNLGSKEINYRTGMLRAEAVRSYLIENGIVESRITTISKGDINPIEPNISEENRRKNRRVELVIY